VPSKPAENQIRHTCRGNTVGSTKLTTIAAQAAPTATAIALATRNPNTWDSSSSLNVAPNQRSTSQAVRRASLALGTANATANPGLLPTVRLHAIDPNTMPSVTGKRAAGPSTMSAPVAMPPAGQKKARPA